MQFILKSAWPFPPFLFVPRHADVQYTLGVGDYATTPSESIPFVRICKKLKLAEKATRGSSGVPFKRVRSSTSPRTCAVPHPH